MPRYDFECETCGEVFEVKKPIALPDPKWHYGHFTPSMPECGGAIQQVIHAPAIRFKGSGFYVNDYGKGK